MNGAIAFRGPQRRPEPPKLQKSVGGVPVDLPLVQNVGDDLADAARGQPLHAVDIVVGPALVQPREDALRPRRFADGGCFFGSCADSGSMNDLLSAPLAAKVRT